MSKKTIRSRKPEVISPEVSSQPKALFIIPSDNLENHCAEASAISKIIHDNGARCCHTSAQEMRFDFLEERHQIKVREALDAGVAVYAFNACTDLVELGIIQLGNMMLNGKQRVKEILGVATAK